MGQVPSDLVQRVQQEYFDRRSDTPPNEDGASLKTRALSALHFVREGVDDLPAVWDAVQNSQEVGIDDRKLLLEKVLTLMAQTNGQAISKQLESLVIDLLYKDLPHPPSGYVAIKKEPSIQSDYRDVPYAYRNADGSNYNILLPTLGMAGTPYARSVPNTNPSPAVFLPDAGLVFDTLLKRDPNGYVEHPGGVSSLFFAFADLVIHSLFNTNGSDPSINNASSYLDLSPLYGSSEQDVNSVRRKDGTGRLWNDVFADRRLLFMPPSASALLVLLCRNHNYIAEKILNINEQGSFKAPKSLDEKARLAQDEEIFQRTRLVNCGYFMQIILDDYVGAILGLTRDGYSWRLPVREAIRSADHEIAPRGEGNVVSVEFNLMYRWHSTLSESDTKWVEEKFREMFPGKDLGKLTRQDFGAMYVQLAKLGDVKTWTFANLKRSQNGRFDNASLAKILQDATEARASAFKARGIPEALRVVELMGIEQARKWGTCSLNQFRTFMGLKPYSSFAEWNPDPSVHRAAEALYHDIENLELYVGMQAEEAKAPGPGAGLCPGYTMSRAILADAVCLTRGDRFMTSEFTPQNLTAWGYEDCQYNMQSSSYGGNGMLTKLLFRTLPEFYPSDSAYAHFPFLVPDQMRQAMYKANPKAIHDYTWSRPSATAMPLHVGRNPVNQSELYERRLLAITSVHGKPASQMFNKLLDDYDLHNWRERITKITSDLIQSKSIDSASARYVDVVRDVVNIAPVRWIAEEIGLTGAKSTTDCSSDTWSIDELHEMFSQIAQYVYLNVSAEHEFGLKREAHSASHFIGSVILNNLRDGGDETLGGLLKSRDPQNYSDKSIEAALIGEVVGVASIFSRAVVSVLNRLLDEKTSTVLKLKDGQSLERYVRDMLADVDDGGIHHGLMNEKFFVAMSAAIIGVIIRLSDIQRAPGRSGELKSFIDDYRTISSCRTLYLDPQAHLSPWPTSLLLQYNC